MNHFDLRRITLTSLPTGHYLRRERAPLVQPQYQGRASHAALHRQARQQAARVQELLLEHTVAIRERVTVSVPQPQPTPGERFWIAGQEFHAAGSRPRRWPAVLLACVAALAVMLFALSAHAAPRKSRPRKQSAWMTECIHERTGPATAGGVSKAEARKLCLAEEPDDEIAAAKAQLTIARLNARVAKAKARAAKAIETCAQAVTDRCVETALPDGSNGDCDVDAGLRAEFELVCLGLPTLGKAPATK